MSSRSFPVLGPLLLLLALILFIGSSPRDHQSPWQSAMEPEAPVTEAKPWASPGRAQGTTSVPSRRPLPAITPSPVTAGTTVTPNVPPSVAAARPALPPMPELVAEAWKQFDRASRARPDAHDLEGPPRQLFPVAAAVARIAMAMRQDASVIPQGIAFFRACAAADSELYSVRAVCLRNLRFWQTKSGAAESDQPEVPEEVARIVRVLPPAR